MGLSTLNFVIPNEVFPMKYRGKCFRMALFINRICSGLVSFSYPALSSEISPSGVFYMYSFISFVGIIFVYYPKLFYIFNYID